MLQQESAHGRHFRLATGEPATPAQIEKKKVMEAVLPGLVSKAGIATFEGAPLVTSAGPCAVPTLVDGASLH